MIARNHSARRSQFLSVTVLFMLLIGMLMAPVQRVFAAGVPAAILAVPPTGFLGEPLTFDVAFDNTSATDPGYGPYINLELPAAGIDGAGAGTDDGITFGAASYLGTAVTPVIAPFICTGSYVHPLTNLTTACTTDTQVIILQPPYGSFTATQPPANITVTAAVSDLADANVPLTIKATAGFYLGNTPAEGDDPAIIGATSSASFTPILFTLKKTYLGPEDETATGPNFPRQYQITVDIANGQTINNLDLTDLLPNNMQFVSVNATTTASGTPTVTAFSTPSTSIPGGTLTRRFSQVVGTAGTDDAIMLFTFYVPLNDAASARVLNPATGDDVTSLNNASTGGTWDTKDARDPDTAVSINPAGPEHTLTDKSIAIQKTVAVVNDVGAAGPTPGDTLEYTLNIQVSDFFAMNGIIVDDTLSDGQRWDGNAPVFSLFANPISADLGSAAMAPANYTVTGNYSAPPIVAPVLSNPAADDGKTAIAFRISNEIVARGGNGRMVGGCVNPNGTTGLVACPGDGPTTATITFRTIIQDEFSDDYPSNDKSVDENDIISNSVLVTSNVLSNTNFASVTDTETDDSAASVKIATGSISKTVYAINGNTTCAPSNDCANAIVAPGETVTYRLKLSLPSSDIEGLTLTDYLPLPIFDVDDNTAPITSRISSFSTTVDASVPAAGTAKFGPSDTFYALSGINPFTSAAANNDSVANSVAFVYGNYDNPTNPASQVDILFTVTASYRPFADRLKLTNQLRRTETSTNSGTDIIDQIVQLTMNEPDLNIRKGVVATNGNGILTSATPRPTGVTVNPANACATRVSGTTTSATLPNSFTSDITGVDAGDSVTYAVVVENTGSGPDGAFDVQIKDLLPAGMTFNTGSLCVNDGTGAVMAFTDVGGGTGFFDKGIELTDPGPTASPIGALDPGKTRVSGAPINNGRNIAIVTFSATANNTIAPRQTLVNTTTLFNFSSGEGGDDFTPADKSDAASVTTADPTLVKTIVSTNQAHTIGTNVAIGEQLQYQVVMTVPEATLNVATIVDTLDAGLAFVSLDSLTPSSGALTTTAAGGFPGVLTNATITNSGGGTTNAGRVASFDFGTLTNSDTNNAVAETITIRYTVVVLDSATNTRGAQRNNSAVWTWDNGTGPQNVSTSAPNERIVEPTLSVAKTANPATGDAGDFITFDLVVQHAGASNADTFNVALSDIIPAGMSYVAGSVANPAGLAPTSFGEAAGTISAVWDSFPLGSTSTIRFTVKLLGSVSPGQIITNSATTTYTSLPGTVTTTQSSYNTLSTERTGNTADPGGAANNYTTTGQANVTIVPPVLQKTIIATSEGNTTGSNVTIGEILRYRLVSTVPEGSSPGFEIRDALPLGLTFLNDGTAKAVLASSDPGLSSSTVSGAGFQVAPFDETNIATVTPTFVVPASAISGGTGAGGAFQSGDDLKISLGDLSNTDNDPDNEYVVVEFNALVDNAASGGNIAGKALNNTFDVWTNGASRATSPAATATVVEPAVTLVKSVAAVPPVKTGDTLVYTLVVANGSGANVTDAYEIPVHDTLDSQLTLTGVTVISKPAATTVTNSTSAPNVDLLIDHLAPGESVTIRVTATVNNVSASGQTIPNTASLTYTSLPGTNGTASNPTGSNNTGAAGSATGERTGTGGAPNTYTASGSSPLSLGTIGDTVWFDQNNSGTQNGTEPGISGVDVTLRLPGPDNVLGNGDDVFVTTQTNATGFYQFIGLPTANYRVTVNTATLPGNMVATFDRDSGNDSTAAISLGAAQVVADADFGYRGQGSIGNYVWLDSDNGSDQDPTEEGLGGVAIAVTWAGRDGVFGNADDATFNTVTAGDGSYSVTGLPDGNYRVVANPTAVSTSLTPTYDFDGIATPSTASVTLTPVNRDPDTLDFGYVDHGTIGDYVWLDNTNPGVQDGTEEGISNVTLNMTWAGANGVFGDADDIAFTTTTDTNGGYSFGGLPPGKYIVAVSSATLPAGLTPTYDKDGTATASTTSLTLTNNELNTTIDFGYTGGGTIGDTVWYDTNSDGLKNATEPGIPNVDITLVWAGPDGIAGNADDITFAKKTDASGVYTFSGLPAGNYTVSVDTADLPGNVIPTTTVAPFTLPANTSHLTADFGYIGAGSIGDLVWLDRDGNGIQNGSEPGIPGATVTVTWGGPDGNLSTVGDNVTYTRTTNTTGAYNVDKLPAGPYRVDVSTLPAGITPTYDFDGIATASTVTTDLTIATPSRDTVDFGYQGNSTIGDLVWFDTDGGGTQNGSEPGIPNVDVTVTWYGPDGVLGGGDDLVFTTRTNASGAYSVDHLPAGNYSVAVDTSDLPGNTVATTTVAPFTLVAGASNLNADFGFKGSGSIGDLVWLNLDGDTVKGANEPGLSNATINLIWAGADGDLSTPGDNVAYTAQTDVNGVYTIGELPLGLYQASVATGSLPNGLIANYDLTGGNDSVAVFTLTSGTPSRTDIDFGYVGSGTIGDTVWFDGVTKNGVKDSGEPGLANITLTLAWAGVDGIAGNADDKTFTTTTDANGVYSFGGLPAGSYSVDLDQSDTDLPAGLTLTFGSDPATGIVLAAGQGITTIDFGLSGTGSIGDRVWNDADGDGTQDPGEQGIVGATVTVTWAGQDGIPGTADDTTFTTTTGVNGSYTVGNLPAGSYSVAIDPTTLPPGLNPSFDTNGIGTPNTTSLTLAAGQNATGIDFGYSASAPTATSAIGDRVWSDANGNGVQDAGEPGIANVAVALIGAGSDGVFGTADDTNATDTTDSNGLYDFSGIPAGSYRVSVDSATLPVGLGETYEADGSLNSNTQLVVAAGETRTDIDFGYTSTNAGAAVGAIGDRVWSDTNGNGLQDAGEPGISNVTVTLLWAGPDGQFGTADDVTSIDTTDMSGIYGFANLATGSYRVSIDATTLPSGVNETYELDSTLNGRADVTLGAGQQRSDVDFGYTTASITPPTGSIGDTVWLDLDGNGIKDVGETGIAGVTVGLVWFGPDGQPNTADDLHYTQATDANGVYTFSGLAAGSYRVSVDTTTLPGGLVATYDRDAVKDSTTTLILANGQVLTDADFGYQGTGSIGDRVWNDANGNGVQDASETGFAGVPITLTWAGPDGAFGTADDVSASTTTLADGIYGFSGLPAGAYTVAVNASAAPLAGLSESYEPDGSMNNSAAVALLAGQNRIDVDFGYTAAALGALGSIGDTVWLDLDANGAKIAGEPGLGGVTVQLIGNGTDNTFGTTDDIVYSQVTDASGVYMFSGLQVDTYRVIVDTSTLPPGVAATYDLDTTLDSKTDVVLAAGANITNADFGYRGSGTIGDTVWNDLDGNGIQNGGEIGIANITVNLTWAGPDGVLGTADDATFSDITGPAGDYSFAHLPAGIYVVSIDGTTVPAGMLPTNDADGGQDAVTAVGLTVGQTRPDIDFGYATPQIDLTLAKSDGGATPAAGATLVYTLNYANQGNYGATGVVITEAVPAHTSFNAAASSAGWTCAGGTCSLTVGNLAYAASGSVMFAVTIDTPLPAGVDTVFNQAAIADDGGHGADIVPIDNTATVTTPVLATPDLEIHKSDGGAYLVAGGSIVYTLNYANTGSQGATGVVISEKVPQNTTFDSTRSTSGWVCSSTAAGSDCTLSIGAVPAGATGSATFATIIISPLPANVTNIANTATISDDGANGVDPTSPGMALNNNRDAVTTGFSPTRVAVVSFTATRQADGQVRLRWSTSAEVDTVGFYVLRAANGNRASAQRITPQMLVAHGQTGGATYEWMDTTAQPGGSYSYWLQEQTTTGKSNDYGPANTAGATKAQQRIFLPLIGG